MYCLTCDYNDNTFYINRQSVSSDHDDDENVSTIEKISSDGEVSFGFLKRNKHISSVIDLYFCNELNELYVLDSEFTLWKVMNNKYERIISLDKSETPTCFCILDGKAFVTDIEMNGVHVIDIKKKSCSMLKLDVTLKQPYGIDVDCKEKEIYISDSGNNRIVVFDTKGNFQREWGTVGSENGQLHNPKGICFNQFSSTLIVADNLNNRIQAFDIFLAGKVVWMIDDIEDPVQVMVDSKGSIMVQSESLDEEQCYSLSDDEDGDDDEEEGEYESDAQVGSDRYESEFEEDIEDDEDEEESEIDVQVLDQNQDEEEEEEEEEEEKPVPIEKQERYSRHNKASNRIHRNFVRDAIEMKQEVLNVKEQVELLRKEKEKYMKRLEKKKSVDESKISSSEKIASNELSFNQTTTLRGGKSLLIEKQNLESLKSSKDPLLLEEQLLEFQILNRELGKAIPLLRNEADEKTLVAEKLERKVKKLSKKLDLSNNKLKMFQTTRSTLNQLEEKMKHMDSKHRSKMKSLEKEKEQLAYNLVQESTRLSRLRLNLL